MTDMTNAFGSRTAAGLVASPAGTWQTIERSAARRHAIAVFGAVDAEAKRTGRAKPYAGHARRPMEDLHQA